MPRTHDGVWVEYETDGTSKRITRVHSAELPALRSAIRVGDDVVRLQYGESLEEALARAASEPPTPAPARASRSRKPGPGDAELPGVES